MSDTNILDAPEQLSSAATTLQSVQTRLEEAAAQRRQDILDRIRQPRRASESEYLADCLVLVHTASAYATVAQGLADLWPARGRRGHRGRRDSLCRGRAGVSGRPPLA
jgi:hypothetical protein